MSDKDYGLEDICVALDAIEVQLKRLVAIQKIQTTIIARNPKTIVEIDQI